MCNPTAIMGMQAAGAGMSAIGAYGSAKSQKSALGFQAEMADLNAALAERRAQIALEQGAFQAAEIERGGARIKGAQRASMGAGNVALNEGSALAVVAGTDLVTAEDARQARINAVRAAFGHRTDATNMKNEGNAARANAKGINPWGAAATSLLGSATSMASSYYGMKGEGAFSGSGSGKAPGGAKSIARFDHGGRGSYGTTAVYGRKGG
jgi:hypothetical protein